MKEIKMQLFFGLVWIAWASIGFAQNSDFDQAEALRKGYEKLRMSDPDAFTELDQQKIEQKIKGLELKQAWERKNAKKSRSRDVLQNETEVERDDNVEYYIEE